MSHEPGYLEQLEHALLTRGLDPEHATAIVGEVSDHLAQSGERPVEAFGDADAYAAALLAADDPQAADENEYERRTFRATATDEVQILDELGRDGWELTGVRDFGLHARRPVEPGRRTTWEHRRRSALRAGPLREQMAAEHFTPSGRWLTFHYFKRAAPA